MYSCLAKVHVSRDPSVRSQMSPLPHLPKVSLNCMYSCHPQDHVSRNPSVYRRISSLPHLPKVSLNCMYSCLAQVHASRNPSARSGCLPFPLTQGRPQLHVFMPSPGSCIQESIRSLQMSPLPHLHKVSLNFTYSCLPQDHVSRNPSARSGCLPFPTYTRSASTSRIHAFPRFMYPGIHPLAPGCLPFPTYTRSASTTTFPKFMNPGIHPLAPDVFRSPLT
nr:uncharacterized protein LOC128705806 isoform X2 [Cherax quadricarinatus]